MLQQRFVFINLNKHDCVVSMITVNFPTNIYMIIVRKQISFIRLIVRVDDTTKKVKTICLTITL